MKAIISGAGQLLEIVYSTAGHDLTGCTVIDPVPEPVNDHVWDRVARAFVPRPPNEVEDLAADPFWNSLSTATPAQIDSWLAANVTSLADARRALKLILLALRALRATRKL
jgi:hypothetical protein